MSIKIAFEVSHAAQRKTKPAKGGFTHDWELYVRSPNKDADLSHFVEKVVFNLHDTFVKPKRSIKEPPYVVKESGYAAFEVIIEIYLKNRDEPRKFTFTYDLDLQPFKSEIKEFTIDNPSDDFRRKCLKGGCIQVGGGSSSSSNVEYKKPKRPEDKTKGLFTDLFGPPLEKQQISKSDKGSSGQQQSSSKDQSSSSSSSKDKDKSSKHKHATSDSKESKKSSESSRSGGSEKVKKDKTKDRERTSDKKEKSSKRAPSPNPSRPTTNVQNLQNSSLPIPAKTDYNKPSHAPKPQTPVPEVPKKSSKKKNYEKDREKNDRKESTKAPKEKVENSSSVKKEKEMHIKNEERQKPQMMESKTAPTDTSKNREKEADRKHKHKKEKKEKTKEKEVKEKERKEPKVKSQPLPVKPKPPPSEKDSESDSDSVSKHDEPMPEVIPQKTLTPPDKSHKKSSNSSRAEKTAKGSAEKDSDSRKRKRKLKDPSNSPSPPPPTKQSKRDYSPSVEKSKDSSLNASNMKVTNEYFDELKDLRNKINTLQSNELGQVVRLIASTGNYEITNSSFDFDLVKLDKSTVSLLRSMLLEKN